MKMGGGDQLPAQPRKCKGSASLSDLVAVFLLSRMHSFNTRFTADGLSVAQ